MPILRAAAACVAALSLAFAGFAVASAAQRREPYVVIWTDRLLLVPSDAAETYVPVPRGSAARLQGQSSRAKPQKASIHHPGNGEFIGVVLADGVAGWVRRDEVYYY